MSLIKRMRKQKAVYWSRGQADRHLIYSYEAPIEIKCRWEDRQEEFVTPEGTSKTSNAVVYVDRPMIPGDVLVYGAKISAHDNYRGGKSGASPETYPKAYVIQAFSVIPNLKATESLYVAYL